MARRNRITPETFTLSFEDESTMNDAFGAYFSKRPSELSTIARIIKPFGFFPFRFRSDTNNGNLHTEISTFWLLISIIILIGQLSNLSFTAGSYILYDSAKWSGLVPTVWLLTPSIIFIQSTFYQIIMLLRMKKLPAVYQNVATLLSILQIPSSRKIKSAIILITCFALLLPFIAYISTCKTISKAAVLNKALQSEHCTIWYSKMFSQFSHDRMWYIILGIQYIALFLSAIGPLLLELWIAVCTKYICDVFRYHLESLKNIIVDDKFVEPLKLSAWVRDFSWAYSLTDEFVRFISPMLLITLVTNPIIFCLQAFWLAESHNYRMFNSLESAVFPVIILVSSFLRVTYLGLSGESFTENVNALSKLVPQLPHNGFPTEIKYQVDLIMYREVVSPLSLTACSFVSFSRMLITTVLGATVTYLIILVQMSSEKPCS
ncbi:uncharacterized protein LOC118188682 [Stegodyphus dumicola]|uniref:uncharacterized protein LOC118188682 n=1 Tax=Stegodyphus dumicola TaxID=202533 RepID=UPI0015B1472C|nr:uncharacterized protein LOC118188682 [Stegodyphus dumicola]